MRVGGGIHDLIAITTSYGNTIAIDPGTGEKLWEFSPPGVNSTPGNPQVTTATPVADPDRRYLYAASPNGVIHKLTVASGHEVWARSHHLRSPAREDRLGAQRQRPLRGRGHRRLHRRHPALRRPRRDDRRAGGRIVHVWNSECSDRHRLIAAASCPVTNTHGDNAIWGRAGAVIEPGNRRILVATGNGPFDGRFNWGNSVLELSADAGRLLHNWTPTNQAQPGRRGRRRRQRLAGAAAGLPRVPARSSRAARTASCICSTWHG